MNKLPALTSCILIFFITSCCRVDDNPNPDYEISVVNIITTGKWKVDLSVKNNINNTADFQHHLFWFEPDGDMVIDSAGMQSTGVWMWNEATDMLTFAIESATLPIIDMEKEWLVISKSGMELQLVSSYVMTNLHLKKM